MTIITTKCDIAIGHFSHGCYLTARQTLQESNHLQSLTLTLTQTCQIFKYSKRKKAN